MSWKIIMKKDWFIAKIKTKYWKTTNKHGRRQPKSKKEAYGLNKWDGIITEKE